MGPILKHASSVGLPGQHRLALSRKTAEFLATFPRCILIRVCIIIIKRKKEGRERGVRERINRNKWTPTQLYLHNYCHFHGNTPL